MKKNKTIYITLGIIIYFLIIYIINLRVQMNDVRVISLASIIILTIITIYLILREYKASKKINFKKMIVPIIAIGIILRTMYILYTPIQKRQHDMDKDVGHLSYIETIYNTGKLPEHNKWQFYQQPLHHIISAIWLKANTNCGVDLQDAMEGIQFLTAIYSSLILIITYCILKEMNLEDKFKLITMIMMAVHPTFILLSGSINNDILMIMFTFLSLLYLIKWNKNPNIKNTSILALSVALGALSKISSTIIAVPIIYIFIKRFIKDYSEEDNHIDTIKKYAVKFSIFAIISLGIGLLFSARNMIKFGQSIFYVPNPGTALYCGYRSWFDRLNIFSKEWSQVFCHPYRDCNIWAYIVKSSLFGEFNADRLNSFMLEDAMKICNIILIFLSIASLIKIIKRKDKNEIITMFIIFWITEMGMYIYGNITKPYGCTMDFRYIVPTIFLGMIFIVTDTKHSIKSKYNIVFLATTILFTILSISFVLTDMSLIKI